MLLKLPSFVLRPVPSSLRHQQAGSYPLAGPAQGFPLLKVSFASQMSLVYGHPERLES